MLDDKKRIQYYLNDFNFVKMYQNEGDMAKIPLVLSARKVNIKKQFDKLTELENENDKKLLLTYLEDCERIINNSILNRKFTFYLLDNNNYRNLNPFKVLLTKCRSINDKKNIIVNLNRERHWGYIKNINEIRSSLWETKKNELVWRGVDTGKDPINNDRLNFVKKYHKKYDVGFSEYTQYATYFEINNDYQSIFLKGHLNLTQITSFKYILILEGNDKSSSLNWVLNSNCVPLMKKPTWHSWLCESFLIPNYHYVELKDDFSDVEEKIQWLKENDDKAKEIAYNGIKYIENNFLDLKRELYLESEIVKTIEPYLPH